MPTHGLASRLFSVMTLAAVAVCSFNAFAQATETVLYSFPATGSTDGNQPIGTLAADAAGNLYGTTWFGGDQNLGTVFQLSPPATADGAWTETVLHSFQGGSAGSLGEGSLIADHAGNLYGRTAGTVFEMSPPTSPGGSWTEKTLWEFDGKDGSDIGEPLGKLVMDDDGNLYGLTQFGGSSNNGVAYELVAPKIPGGSWTERILHEFGANANDGTRPAGALALRGGILYGAAFQGLGTSAQGAIFQLVRQPGRWAETILYQFTGGEDGNRPMGVIADANGNLYGTTLGVKGCQPPYCGTVFELSPPTSAGGSWHYTNLFTFNGNDGLDPNPDLWRDKTGALYGTCVGGGQGGGTVFKLKPPAQPGGEWTWVFVYNFAKAPGDGAFPAAGLIMINNVFYATTQLGGNGGGGTVFSLKP